MTAGEKNAFDVKILPSSSSCKDKEVTKHHWTKESRVQWSLMYFVGNFLVYSVRSSISICATAIGKDLGWNKHIAGMALSAFFCGYVTTNVLGGYLADRYGGECIIFYTALGWATLTMLMPIVAHSQWLFYSGTIAVLATRFLTGVTQGVFYPSLIAVFSKHMPVEERGFLYGFSCSGSAVGTIVTGFVGSILIEKFGWPIVFTLIGLMSLVWTVWLRYLDNFYNSIPAQEFTLPIQQVKEPPPWGLFLRSRPVWALFIAYFCQSYCFYNVLAWTPVYFHDAFPQSKGWVFNVIPWLFAFIVANLAGFYANKMAANGIPINFTRKLYATFLFLGTAIFSLILTSVESFNHALIIMSLLVGCNAFATCSIALNAQDLSPKHSGALFGIMNSNGAFAGFVGVYITGHILETTASWASVFMSTTVMALAGFFVYVIFGSANPIDKVT